MQLKKTDIQKLRQAVNKANRRSNYYAKKGKDVLPKIKTKDLLKSISNKKEYNRYIKILDIYNTSKIDEWSKKLLKKVGQYAKYDKKVKQKEPPKNKQGFTFLGSDVLAKKFEATYKKYPKSTSKDKEGKGRYVLKHLYRTTKEYSTHRNEIFKQNYMQIIREQLGIYGESVANMIDKISANDFYPFYLRYQDVLDVDFVYTSEDAKAKAKEIKNLTKSEFDLMYDKDDS